MTNDELRLVIMRLIDAILRKGTDQDGNWGHMSVREELRLLIAELASRDGDQQ
jgi:hypothetical protein